MAITIPVATPTAYPLNTAGNGVTGLAIEVVNIGDLFVQFIFINDPTIVANGITNNTGGRSWSLGGRFHDPNSNCDVEVWYWISDNSVTAGTTVGTTVSYSGSVTSTHIEINAFEFHAPPPVIWQIVAEQGLTTVTTSNGASITAFPPMTSDAAVLQLYVGFIRNNVSSMANGSSIGFSYLLTPSANLLGWNLALAQNTFYQPAASTANTGQGVVLSAIGAIFAAIPGGGNMFIPMLAAMNA